MHVGKLQFCLKDLYVLYKIEKFRLENVDNLFTNLLSGIIFCRLNAKTK